jgi:hypothetical protein
MLARTEHDFQWYTTFTYPEHPVGTVQIAEKAGFAF